MEWSLLFDQSREPAMSDIESFLGTAAENFQSVTSYIENSYKAKPILSFSKCSMQPGWNVKYKKSGKALCTLYPMNGYFIVLIVVGVKEENEVSMAAEANMLTPYITELFRKTPFSCGGKWLMIEVRDKDVLPDVKFFLETRVKPINK